MKLYANALTRVPTALFIVVSYTYVDNLTFKLQKKIEKLHSTHFQSFILELCNFFDNYENKYPVNPGFSKSHAALLQIDSATGELVSC